jgi:predicted nucleic acid-binding protein
LAGQADAQVTGDQDLLALADRCWSVEDVGTGNAGLAERLTCMQV